MKNMKLKKLVFTEEYPTPELRWLRREDSVVLQQRWVSKKYKGDKLIDLAQVWQDVPLEDLQEDGELIDEDVC